LREGRLFPGADAPGPQDTGDQCTIGLNFQTKRPRRDVLADYRAVLDAVYDPAAYFGRVRRVGRMLRCGQPKFKPSLPQTLRDLRLLGRLVWRLPQAGPGTGRLFWKSVLDCAIHNPRALRFVVMMSALYLHHGPFSRQVIAEIDRQIGDIDFGRWTAPQPVQADYEALSVA
jgi:Domain of unknown function (DUF4070)